MKVITIGHTASRGEREFRDEITSWVTPHHINGVALIAPNHPVRADAVILTPSGPVVVEVKTLNDDVEGELTVPVNDEWRDARGPLKLITHGDVNPIGQVSVYATDLRNHLKARTGLATTYTLGLVVLVQPNTRSRVRVGAKGGIKRYPRKSLGVDVTALTRFGGNAPLRQYFLEMSAPSAQRAWSVEQAEVLLEAMGLSRTSSKFPSEEELLAEGFVAEKQQSEVALTSAQASGSTGWPINRTDSEDTELMRGQPSEATQANASGPAAHGAQTDAADATRSMPVEPARAAHASGGTGQDADPAPIDALDVTPSAPWSRPAEQEGPTRIVETRPGVSPTDETRSVPITSAPRRDQAHTRSVPQTPARPSQPNTPPPIPSFAHQAVPSHPWPAQAPPPALPTTRATPRQRAVRAYEPSVTAPGASGSFAHPKKGNTAGCLLKVVGILFALWLAVGLLAWGVKAVGNRTGSDEAAQTLVSTKSGNIVCRMTASETRCDINKVKYRMSDVPSKCSGSSNWGHTFVVSGSAKARLECPAERMLASEQSTEQLEWGQTKTVGTTTCTSSPQNVTCTSGQHGFRLRQAKYDVW